MYFAAIAILSFAVAVLTAADFGISMIVAPAYLLSLKSGFLTFGQAEYVIQAGLFALFCIIMKKVKLTYLSSFITCLIYGAVLDLWRMLPLFDPDVTPPGSMSMPSRIFMFIVGVLLTSLSIAMFYKTFLYPQVYDFFVKGVSSKFKVPISKFKTCFDVSCLIVSVVMSFGLFGRAVGIGWGTVLMAFVNGFLIGKFGLLLDRYFEFKPISENFKMRFSLNE